MNKRPPASNTSKVPSPSNSKGGKGKVAAPGKPAPKPAEKPPAKGASKPPKKNTPAQAAGRRPQKPVMLERLKRAWNSVPFNRKLDILGIVLVLGGILLSLSLVSPLKGEFTGALAGIIKRALGLGMYLLPLGLIITGLWLVVRTFREIPELTASRVIGLLLLFVNLLLVIQVVYSTATGQASAALVESGRGGGQLGAAILELLRSALGTGGMVIVLLAWLVIALDLALDMSILEMFAWLPAAGRAITSRAQQAWARLRQALAARRSPAPPLEEFSPLPESESQPVSAAAEPGPASGLVWRLPHVEDILEESVDVDHDDDLDRERAQLIEQTLVSFGAPARVVEINRGPTITQFGVEPDFIETRTGRMRVRVNKIASLADDLALALSARTIRIQAPVPGKGFVGIEVPNEQAAMVSLRDVIESEAFRRQRSLLRFAMGQNVSGEAVAADLGAMPHLLIAGATGSGKSVCVNALICCLLLYNTPDALRLIMVDPKRVELTGYNGIPHLLAPVVVELEKVVSALQWVTREMDMRYRKLSEAGTRNIDEFNKKQQALRQPKLPRLVVIIDELADLMMLSPDETERAITRLAQLARATGIHLVLATQRPSVDVVTGLIKANIPARIAFAVTSNVDSRTILDQPGAERLLGRGDMLYQAPDAPAPVRLQGVYVSDNEIQSLVQFWQAQVGQVEAAPVANLGVVGDLPVGVPLKQMPLWDEGAAEQDDPLLVEAIDLARRQGRASTSMLQRRLRIGYTRAARLVEVMEARGIVGPPEEGSNTRPVLDYGPAAPPQEEYSD